MSIPHIVIVEDNLPDVMVFREALARRGIAFTIEHFSDGEKASAAIAAMTGGPDLFVLDLNLPRVDGLSLLRQIRKTEATAHTAVAVLTTSQAAADRANCEALGADAYVVKPGNFSDFVDRVGTSVQILLSKSAANCAQVSPPAEPGLSVATQPMQLRHTGLAAILARVRRRSGGRARAARSSE